MKNQEVVKYACALTRDKERFIKFVYSLLQEYILKQTDIPKHMFDLEASFLQSLLKEVSDELTMDPLHNQYINYTTQGDLNIFIPSKLYIFGPAKYRCKEVKYMSLENFPTSSDVLQAECVMKLGHCDKEDAKEDATEILKILQHINETGHQEVSISYLDWKNISLSDKQYIRDLAHQTLKISQNLTSICMWSCIVPPAIYNNIVAELQHCHNLQRLDLSECRSMDIAGAIRASKSLNGFYLYDSVLSPEAYKHIAVELKKHHNIQNLHLKGTKGVPFEMSDAVAGMKSLQVFRAGGCGINKTVVKRLLKNLGNCSDLEELWLGMNVLTGYLTHLFQNHSGFVLLKYLWIKGGYLNEHDIKALSDALRANKLPRLEHLDLSMNYEVAGRLSSLLNGTHHPGFPFLMYLDLMKIQLKCEDVLSIAEAVNDGLMPKLRILKLDNNDLSTMTKQVHLLVQSCTSSYKKLEVIVQVFNTNLEKTFVNELQSLCEGSVVLVKNVRE